jgi:hypothetical protein
MGVTAVNSEPVCDSLRSDARYSDLVLRMELQPSVAPLMKAAERPLVPQKRLAAIHAGQSQLDLSPNWPMIRSIKVTDALHHDLAITHGDPVQLFSVNQRFLISPAPAGERV